jgi:hypothetical protein
MNPNTPDTPTDSTPTSSENINPLVTDETVPVSTESVIEPTASPVWDATQEITSPEVVPTSTFNTVDPIIITDPGLATVEPTNVIESIQNNTVIDPTSAMESAPIVESLPVELTPNAISNPTEVAPSIPAMETTNPPIITNTPDTPKKWKGLLLGTLWVLGLVMLSGVGFAWYTYYERVTHPDWTASEIGVFIRDGVIDSLASHAMTLSGSEPTFTTINTNYLLSWEGKRLEVTGFKNPNATLNMSGSAYMEPMTTSGSLPVFDGSFTMTLSLEWSGDKWMKWSLAIGVDAKSTGDTTLYIRPNSIKLVAPNISDISEVFDVPIGSHVPFQEINNLNKTYLGKWYKIDLKKAGEELPKLVSEIPGIPYGIPTESIDTEKFVKQQQEAEKQMKDHLGKLQAIFDKHTLIQATARDTGWKSYLDPRSITYDASLNQEGLSALLLDMYGWAKDTPVGEWKTAGVMYSMENVTEKEKEEFQKFIKGITLEFVLSWDMKKHGDMELKKFTFREDESSPTIALHDFMKTKVDRDGTIVKVVKSGSMCGLTKTQSGTTKSICDEEGYAKPGANFVYAANATLAPQNFSLSGNVDVLGYNDEKKSFDEKLGLIKFDMNVTTSDNTATKFTQKINLNVNTHIEQVNTNIKFSLDGSQTTETVGKRVIDPVSESIDVIETIKDAISKQWSTQEISYPDISNTENSGIQVNIDGDINVDGLWYQTLAEKLSSCTPYQSQFTHPFTDEMMERKILGIVNGKCSYIESMPNNGKMECNYTDDQRTAAARYYNNMTWANPLQTFMNDGTCVISGY